MMSYLIKKVDNHRDILPLIKRTMPREVYNKCVKVIDDYQDERRLWGVYIDKNLVGCSGVVLESDGTAWISWTAVDRKWRGFGIGKALLQKSIRAARGRRIWVETYEHPIFFTAICLYLKLGFRLGEMKKNYLSDGSSVFYLKRLPKNRSMLNDD